MKKGNALKIGLKQNHLRSISMSSIPISKLLTNIFVMVDDWYREHSKKLLAGKLGKKLI